jgi:dTDP-4-amino-4,6-dideoxygalactose transaminase
LEAQGLPGILSARRSALAQLSANNFCPGYCLARAAFEPHRLGMKYMRVYSRHMINLNSRAFAAFFKTFLKGNLLEGGAIRRFEEAFAQYTGVKYAVAVASARLGLWLGLKALGLKEGDEVILPAYTFHAMPIMVKLAGTKPVFVDVDSSTYNINPELIEAAITPRTRAIILAHIFGQPADMEKITDIAERNGLFVIEDCAHSLGASFQGKKVGAWGKMGLFSFSIGKNMPCFGGGMVTTDDGELAEKLRGLQSDFRLPSKIFAMKAAAKGLLAYVLTHPGVFPFTTYSLLRILSFVGSDWADRSVEEEVSLPGEFPPRWCLRMANFQAAAGLEQLKRVEQVNASLAKNGAYLSQGLASVPGVVAPLAKDEHIYLYFRVLVEDTQKFRRRLLKRGVDTQRDDMCACNRLDIFKEETKSCPVAESLPARSVEIPNNVSLSRADLDYIIRAVKEAAE